MRELKSGVDTTFGNVTSYAWQDKGTHLAMTIGVDGREGNAVQLFDPTRGELKVLDSGNAVFTALAWRKDSADLAALRSARNKDYEGESNTVLAWKNLGAKTAGEVAAPKRVVASRAPQWSEDGSMIFVGIAAWDKKIESAKSEEEPSNVEVWHPRDTDVISAQKLRLARDRDRHVVAAWHIAQNRIVPLGTNVKETMQLPRSGGRAVAIDDTPYESTGMFGRRYVDVYKVDLASGARAKIATKLSPPVLPSPGGRYVLNFKDGEFWIYDLESGDARNVSKAAGVSFIDKEDDHPSPARPSWGVAGWTKNDASVIVNGEFDLWELLVDGSKAKKLTDGATEQVRHRYVNPENPVMGGRGGRGANRSAGADRSGEARLRERQRRLDEEGRLRARDRRASSTAPCGSIAMQAACEGEERRCLRVEAEAFEAFRPTRSRRARPKRREAGHGDQSRSPRTTRGASRSWWSTRAPKGDRLQGALFYPANYDPAKKYPLIVHIYERESQFLHRWFPVSDRSPYSEGIWTRERVLRAHARHRVPPARPRPERAGVRDGGHEEGAGNAA